MAFFSPFSRRPIRRSEPRLVRRATHVASVWALLAMGSAHAQGLTEITITDTAPSQVSGFGDVPLSKAPFSAVTIDQHTLQDIGAQRVSDALRLDASVADSYNSPAYWDMLSVRGYTLDNRYNYRREGLPISAETMISMDNKERIELFKGTSGIQAGTSAPGGLVNYVVKRPPSAKDETIRSVSASYGSGKSSSIGLDLGGRFGQDQTLGYRFNAAYEDLDPYIQNTEGHRRLLALAMDWRITPDSKLEWEIERSERQQFGVNGYSLMGDALPAPVDGTRNITRQAWSVPGVFNGTTGSIRFKQNLEGGWLWTTQYGGQRLRTDDRLSFAFGCGGANCDRYYADGGFDLYDWRSDKEQRTADALQSSLAGHVTIGQMVHNMGISISRQRQLLRSPDVQTNIYMGTGNVYDSAVIPGYADYSDSGTNASEYTTELALNDRIEVNAQTTLWLGLRHSRLNRNSAKSDGTQAIHDERSFNTPWIAGSYQLTPHETLYASYGEGIETEVAPNKSKYINSGQALPALRSQQFELGIKSQTRTTRWQVSVFDITRPQSTDFGDCVAANSCKRLIDGEARHRGLELSAGMTRAAWSWDVGAAWLDAKRQSAEVTPDVNGQRALNVPKYTLRGLVHYRFADVPGLRTSLRLSHEGARRVTADGSINLPSWTTLDFAAHYDTRISGTRTQWTLAIDNLADHHYWREAPKQFGHYYLYPGAPRTFRMGVKASF
ncbi:TonB-dependent siderophore receptor [Limnohabitans sp. T6-20]|uniref:TonB-dependent siderophore receptor n=1 Tax=Limnohabitans sp. T6-20 TaxID=1100725 RepID=UPI000D3B9426|nr:TonB-dependent siderophore receptor [Limnohabitans sp. T6-20]PUE10153.1 hypothetical protein B9Z33_08555 [Limnohabitans sp. T6-20]